MSAARICSALPLAYSLGMIINCVLLFLLFQKKKKKEFGDVWVSVRKTFFEVLGASLLMGVVAYFSLNFLDDVF